MGTQRARPWIFLATCVAAGCGAFSGASSSGGAGDTADAASDGASADASVTDGNSAVGTDANANDASSASDARGDADAASPDAGIMHVFVSEELFETMNATTVCQPLADDAGLGGTWVAWLARPDGTPLTHIGAGPWHRVDAPQTLVATITDLESGQGIQAPVLITQHNQNVVSASGTAEMWTGVDAFGAVTGNSCMNWSALSGSAGTIGYADQMGAGWTTTGYTLCGYPRHVYCFQTQ